MIKKIDDYYLNMPVKEIINLRELTLEGYRMFESVGIKRILKDEKIYRGKDINFAGAIWDMLIGATEGRIYKISIQNVSADKNESEQIFKLAYDYLFKEMGKHSEYHPSINGYSWYSNEGNVLLDQAGKVGMYGVQISLTSSLIRQQPEKLAQLFEARKTAEKAYDAYKDSSSPKKKSSFMGNFWFYFWRIGFMAFTVLFIGSGITGIIMPYRFIQTSEGRISIGEYQSLPLQTKLISFGLAIFQIILGSWFLYKTPLRKDKIISIILIILFVSFYCFVIAPAIK